MATKAVATLANTGPREWTVTEEGTGRLLVRLVGMEGLVLSCAAASLVADHGFPFGGIWVPDGPGRYLYTVEEDAVSSSSAADLL